MPTDDEAQEALSRYTLEFILFRYDDSVSAGTEIFVAPGNSESVGAGQQFDLATQLHATAAQPHA